MDQTSGIDYNWEDHALCRSLTKEQKKDFFPLKHDGEGKQQVNRARKLCSECPVVVECLHASLVTNEKFGVWGMTSPKQRQQMRKKYTITNEDGEKVALYNDIDNVVEILADHISNMVEVGPGYYPVLTSNPNLRENRLHLHGPVKGGKEIIEN
tara:strand:- start:19 stop:480 length:462 start_codon:yes stop_codon:yes gene_type:complete